MESHGKCPIPGQDRRDRLPMCRWRGAGATAQSTEHRGDQRRRATTETWAPPGRELVALVGTLRSNAVVAAVCDYACIWLCTAVYGCVRLCTAAWGCVPSAVCGGAVRATARASLIQLRSTNSGWQPGVLTRAARWVFILLPALFLASEACSIAVRARANLATMIMQDPARVSLCLLCWLPVPCD
jgi:hypothetical protein